MSSFIFQYWHYIKIHSLHYTLFLFFNISIVLYLNPFIFKSILIYCVQLYFSILILHYIKIHSLVLTLHSVPFSIGIACTHIHSSILILYLFFKIGTALISDLFLSVDIKLCPVSNFSVLDSSASFLFSYHLI